MVSRQFWKEQKIVSPEGKKLQVFACKRRRGDFTVWVTEFALGSRLSIDVIAEDNSKGKIYYLTQGTFLLDSKTYYC